MSLGGDGPQDHPVGVWCHSCWKPEPNQPGDYRSCVECGHVYRTALDLVLADAVPEGVLRRSADEIHSCPLCAHDFT